jgi:RNA polymerase sigma-70 factor (ECF subfamily)
MEHPVPESPSDVSLLELADAGDASAFDVLFRRHSRAVYNYCFRRLGSWSAAEDAMSVVFLEAWRRRADLVALSDSLRPWLLGVATNVVRNQQRAARRYDTALYRLPPADAEPDPADDVAGRIDDERRWQRVLHGLAGLKRHERDVVALVVLADLSYEEAALALDVPVGTVRSRLARARARLAAAYSETASGEPNRRLRPVAGSEEKV